ncbi:MAG: flagellar motor switch phosphatase FliY [Selenomonas sp.]|uniref:flagellar motor switch phosphatase FliY n=1 Tax=Selenomonas sp. AE3005 TaxID=1485543 RepID=UPI000484DA8B|nr:flagellar motor switch phosphatase FliY [Selenomonas sp. AE3005]MBQ1613894.1 flagellar motor switch phosphatase FliY [Selenomonas sp.]MBQ4213500.1 flagellar motor switch phosphatase FliY [Selenomonas sp.]
MSDDMISQEEIDALLNGGGIPAADGDAAPAGESEAPAEEPASPDSSSSQFDDVLTDIEKDALGEIGNISMGSAATTLSVLLGHKVNITTPTVSVSSMSIIQEQYPMPYLIVEVGYTIGIDGNNVLAIQAQDAAIIADLMMGGDGTNPDTEINEIAMSAVGESMNQMMGTVATSLSTMFNKKIDISPPKVNLIDFGNEDKVSEVLGQTDPIVCTSFRMEVDGLIDSEIMQILPVNVAKEMVEALTSGAVEEPEPEPAPAPAPPPPPPPPAAAPAPAPAPAAAPPPMAAPQQQMAPPVMAPPPGGGYGYGMPMPGVAANVPVQPAQFTPLNMQPVQVNDANIGLILDVPLSVTVELGRTNKSIKDILELTNGSIVELDKLAGEPVDINVNGKFLAKGEVVVIDENFGVRITEIASPAERAAKLQ